MPNRNYAEGMDSRLHVVTGKGGTGKSTIAMAQATAWARAGYTTLYIDVEGRNSLAPIYQLAQFPYKEIEISKNLWAMSVDPRESFLEYLDLFYRAGAAVRALDKFGVVDFVSSIAPGLRDVLLIGKAYEAVRRRPKLPGSTFEGPWIYDKVIIDAPPTGRIGKFLDVNSQLATLAKVGPIHDQALSISELVKSDMTSVHFVTTAEELPIQETIEGISEIQDLGISVGTIYINKSLPCIDIEMGKRNLPSAVVGQLDLELIALETKIKKQEIEISRLSNNDSKRLPYITESDLIHAIQKLADYLD